MASREFIYLDTAPINEALLTPDKKLTEALDYRRQLNLAINCYQAESALANHQANLPSLFQGQNVTVSGLNLALESYLTVLIPLTTIASLDLSQLSPHYQRRKILVPDHFMSPDRNYLEQMLFTSSRTWGTSYGSLGYFLHLGKVTSHYLHPSQIVYQTSLELIKQLKGREFLNDFPNQFEALLSQEDAVSDLQLYQLPVQLLSQIPAVRELIKQLDFYEQWLPQVIAWYLLPLRTNQTRRVPEQGTREAAAVETLEQIAQLCLKNGLDETSFNQLSYQFIHQSIPPVLFGLLDDLMLLRKKAIGQEEGTEAEKLLEPFIQAISLNNPVGLLKATSQSILEDLCPPGGYNLLLLCTAANLLNRAFILTHPTRTIYANYIIAPLKNGFPELMQYLGRIYRLIYLAGYCLKKSNLDHLQLTGVNLITLSAITDNSPIRITDLTK